MKKPATRSKAPLRIRTSLLVLGLLLPTADAARADFEAGPATLRPARELQDVILLEVGRSQQVQAPWQVKGAAITDPTVADIQVLTPELLMVSGRAAGVTDIVIWGEGGRSRDMRVEVKANLDRLLVELQSLLPGATVQVQQSHDVVLVSGALADAAQAEHMQRYLDARAVKYVNTTSIPGPQQVHVKVRIAEVSRTALRTMGVNGFVAGEDGFIGSTIGSSSGGALNPISIGFPQGSSARGGGIPTFTDALNVSPLVTLFGGSGDFEVFIQALQENQYLRILAEPALTALSGEEASFLAGGEFPIPVVQGSAGGGGGGTSITIEYKEFGVGLKFRPVVLGNGKIRIHVASEVSDLSDIGAVEIEGFRVPSIVTRRADSTLELHSGQTFAMAGLISENASAVASRTPILGDLPILGSLFRSVRYRKGETELLLMVSVSLVEPLSEKALPPMPGTTDVVPSDWELYVEGSIYGATPPPIPSEQTRWFQEHGFDRLKGPGAWARHGDAAPPQGGTWPEDGASTEQDSK